ncbi:2-oxo-hepta-3-ene-1,7-dioic acid hydratase [SAR116 cluster bacterium]|nr:2-oxo-hepta-3-ene-1,7-dioic acid hydratase [SAR116 cluster bacterium]
MSNLSKKEIDAAGDALFAAERDRSQTRLMTGLHPAMNMDDAYAIQAAFVERKLATGGAIHGWKIGLTSKAMQYALNIDIPDSGILFEDMFFEHGGSVPAGRFIEPRIEAEIAFIMAHDLSGEDVTPADVIAATEAVAPALEILDTRIFRLDPETGSARTVLDTISDNAANAGIVMGDLRHPVNAFDLCWVGAIVSRNDEVEETGLGAGVLNDPVLSMAWLVHRLAKYGSGLRAGDVVLSGSFIRPIEARHDDRFVADYGPFGTVRIDFE